MDLKQLRLFLHVADLGGFAKAAEVLNVGQPMLSRQIRALEVSVGATLFHRHGRGISLTPEGVRFIDHARGVLHAAETAIQVLHRDDRRYAGRVVFGLTPSVGRVMIPALVRAFREQLPHATLAIVNLLSVALQDHMRAGRLDFAIMHTPQPSPEISVTPLSKEELFLIGPGDGADHAPVRFAELAKLPLAIPSTLHLIRREVDREAARAGIRLNIVLEVDVVESLFDVVAAGFGHTVATKFPLLSPSAPTNLVARSLVAPSLSTELCLVTPTTRKMTPLQSAAAELARKTFFEVSSKPISTPASR